jgi:hypothetical protein
VGYAPAKVDHVEPEFGLHGRVGAEPRFEVGIGDLPVVPVSRDGAHSASLGAKVINI